MSSKLKLLAAIKTVALCAAERWMAANNFRAKGVIDGVRLARRVCHRVTVEAPAWLRNGGEMAACGLNDAAAEYTLGVAAWAGILEAKQSCDLLESIAPVTAPPPAPPPVAADVL